MISIRQAASEIGSCNYNSKKNTTIGQAEEQAHPVGGDP